MTGLTACGGGSSKVSEQSFIDDCLKGLGDNATAKAYGDQICKCAQDKLKAQGLGDKTADDKSAQEAATREIGACTVQVATGH
jgi:hypothetical protein